MKLTNYQKEMLKQVVPSLVFIVLFFTVYAFIPGKGLLVIISLMLSMVLCSNLLKDIRKKDNPSPKAYAKNTIILIVIISVFYYVSKFLGAYGLLGTLALILLFVFYKLYRRKMVFLNGMREVEKQMFGKSLDKANWHKGEIKMPKLKVKR